MPIGGNIVHLVMKPIATPELHSLAADGDGPPRALGFAAAENGVVASPPGVATGPGDDDEEEDENPGTGGSGGGNIEPDDDEDFDEDDDDEDEDPLWAAPGAAGDRASLRRSIGVL